ncbi:unnamed protein product [Penicillium olsonii]|uniref:Oxidoreductase NAD-binding domain-containing protein 1 n=1 Tax=Penicillium olsonii TaxID=99116 RepID=A0A9W4HYW6_PENOL|nr:unnamed protein product [Penicillium olsonii]CAG8201734.1 unnamed protein product [Penicillium olsonii]
MNIGIKRLSSIGGRWQSRLHGQRQFPASTSLYPNLHPTASRASQIAQMSSKREDSIPHELRTAAEPRQNRRHPVQLSHVEQINPSVRLLHFTLSQENNNGQPFSFLPGQWLDVHIPSIAQAGGFTITSTPADAKPLPIRTSSTPEDPVPSDSHGRAPYVELAVQNSPKNPSAAWLWKPEEEIIGKELSIRVGGSFVWSGASNARNAIFIAGGVGINPLISMLSHINNNEPGTKAPDTIRILYTSRLPRNGTMEQGLEQILFLPRLRRMIRAQETSHRLRMSLDLFLTNVESPLELGAEHSDIAIHTSRIQDSDLRKAVCNEEAGISARDTVCYVCGPPQMTDSMVERLEGMLGEGGDERIFYEKWW